MRLDKLLADSSIGTRSEVKTYIKKGRVTVNGVVCVKPEQKVEIGVDEICYDNEPIKVTAGFRYYIMNKPAGVITATRDDRDKTVLDLLPLSLRKGISPVGRLDKDTEGLLLLTDDGAFNHKLMAPKKHVPKKYFARLLNECNEDMVEAFKRGVDIGDEKLCKPAILEILDKKNEVYITITEGRYHQVKRMFEAFNNNVEYLRRVSIGHLELPSDLKPGSWREMAVEEINLFL